MALPTIRLFTGPGRYIRLFQRAQFSALLGQHLEGSRQPLTTSTRRPIELQKINDPQSQLVAQRLRRPIAPHLSIYKWQITSVLSVLERITGILFSAPLYVFGSCYAANHFLGLGFDMSVATAASAFGAFPAAVKVAVKFGIALPFVFHGLNGLRYLTWDTARMITNPRVKKSGLMVVCSSMAVAFGLAMWQPSEEQKRESFE